MISPFIFFKFLNSELEKLVGKDLGVTLFCALAQEVKMIDKIKICNTFILFVTTGYNRLAMNSTGAN